VSDQTTIAHAMAVPTCCFVVIMLFAWQRQRRLSEVDN
jgi:fucose permease